MYTAKERLWLNPDGKAVPEGKQLSGARLLATPGDELSDAAAERYGLTRPAEPKAQPAPPETRARRAPAEDK
jgi:hypothetical protein